MGLFSRKEDRIYSLSEAMSLLKTEKYARYTTIPVGDGYKLVPIEMASEHIKQYKAAGSEKTGQDARNTFAREISGNGIYRNINNVPNYNNYQSVRGYRGQTNYISER